MTINGVYVEVFNGMQTRRKAEEEQDQLWDGEFF
jgi:hypothetical protein